MMIVVLKPPTGWTLSWPSKFGSPYSKHGMTLKKLIHYHRWLIRVILLVDLLSLPKNIGPVSHSSSRDGGKTGSETGGEMGPDRE